MVKIQRTRRGQHVITIPKAIIRVKKWKRGQELIVGLGPHGQVTLTEVVDNGKE
jgi:hypothetical protein